MSPPACPLGKSLKPEFSLEGDVSGRIKHFPWMHCGSSNPLTVKCWGERGAMWFWKPALLSG